MKRLITLLALACALMAASACHYDISLSVDASADLLYDDGTSLHINPVTYTGFHRYSLSNEDLEWIFTELTRKALPDFKTAVLHLDVFNEITGAPLREENYGVVYNGFTGHFDFADLDVIY